MASNTDRLSACDLMLCSCTCISSINSKEVDSLENISGREECISERLKKLPEIKAKPGFNQRMAAAFAMEIERETLQRNRSWLKKHPNIRLPEIVTDLKTNFL